MMQKLIAVAIGALSQAVPGKELRASPMALVLAMKTN